MEEYYDKYNYQAYWKNRDYEDQAEKICLKRILETIRDHQSLVDIGGGFGRLTPVYAPFVEKVTLVDPSSELLRQAKEFTQEYKNVTFKTGKVENLPFAANQFEIALMIRVVHHLIDPDLAIAEAARILKPGGYLILEFANKIHLRARLTAYLRGDFDFSGSLVPADRRSTRAKRKGMIPFFNQSPKYIYRELANNRFKIIDKYSVSNFRFQLIKKIVPFQILLFMENSVQKPFSKFYFGPSIFLLCQKIK